jgi:formylglycine-generating enzyme required for sulfatase activity
VPGNIFVNYRREDARADARGIFDRLAGAFGKANVFMDVDDLKPGERFDQKLDEALAECKVFVAVIGSRWLEILKTRAGSGKHDFVRQEIAAALARGIFVVPVLVDGAQLPRSEDLPDDIRTLVLHQKQDVTHERFGRDIADLISFIEPKLPRGKWKRFVLPGLAAALFFALLVVGVQSLKLWRPGLIVHPVEDSALRSGDAFRDCEECPEMVVVSMGEFIMGSPESESGRGPSERPAHRVRIGKAIAIGKYEVQVKEYEAFIASTGGVSDGGGCNVWTAYGHRFERDRSYKSPSFSQGPSNPVVCVSWQAATTYANWLTTRARKKYRLPSEAEWEYAARAGSTTRYYFGDNEGDLCLYGNGADRTSAFLWGNHLCSDGVGVQTAEVGKFRPNAFGLYDTIGNASEWVQDCWNDSYDNAPLDGSPRMNGDCSNRVIRGGAWDNGPNDLRSANRSSYNMQPKDTIGFRVLRELDGS